LRNDEIRRMRVGCTRTYKEDVVVEETGEVLSKDAVCQLHIPTNKTGVARVGPVNPVVHQAIKAWEAERPAQAKTLDWKTRQYFDALFALRGKPIAEAYLNKALIPRLCDKAGIPYGDERGSYTSHRARSTIATVLYNAPEAMSISELAEFLGHKSLRSTEQYARLKPKRLAVAYTKADQNSVLVETLVDLEGGPNNTPKVYTVLDDDALCSNPEWAECPHRMACKMCQFHVPTQVGRVIAARTSVQRMLQRVELRPEERTALEQTDAGLTRTITRARGRPLPVVLNRRPVGQRTVGIPLSELSGDDTATEA
jgi:hypothetical protein